MKIIQCLVIASAISSDTVLAVNILSVEAAEKKGLVRLVIQGKGGHTGKVIEMKIHNVSGTTLNLKLEAGRKLDSKNNSEQDILVTKPESFILAAGQKSSYNVYGMCCQAHNSSPGEKSFYSIGKMGDSTIVKLAEFIHKNKYYDDHGAQQAVWTISDNNSLASIQGSDEKSSKHLQKYVSDITGRPIPAYDVYYKQQDEKSVLGRVSKINGNFAYSLPRDLKITAAIYNSEGKMVQLIMSRHSHDRGDYQLFYTFNAANLPAGTYYARVSNEDTLIKEERIDF
ncbi:MAG TPA: hypothetical protein VF868_12055 [Bacteroidia bacterium]|jgi:uncharacterized protein Veg